MVVLYRLCEEGDDSARMALELMDLGYSKENIKVLEGGLIEWDAAGYPMIKEKDFINRKEVSTTGESHPISGIDV